MYSLLKPFLFSLNPEKAHHFTFSLLKSSRFLPGFGAFSRGQYCSDDPRLKRKLFGLEFKNPVGLAAGLDKDAIAFNELGNFGFGFIEIGTVTPKPQPGNDKPRLFRLIKDEALINRMGFNNKGAFAAAEKLKVRKDPSLLIGGNIGKNKVTPNENATDDYIQCFNALYEVVDYFVVNVSSPNTPNLRDLQEKEPLTRLLNTLQDLNKSKKAPKPILLKIAPDLTDSQLDDIIDIVKTTKIDGVIATNTTISREGLSVSKEELDKIGMGGLSGKPLTKRSTEVIRYLKQKSGNAFPVIGVGGIHSAEDALEKLAAGADLLQLYTGFIYKGPKLVKEINDAILAQK
ncbi:MAG: quinone-dependent dihydroorotate dehydrogenase [Bacteroidetes bacterium]|jgi:dihydroorotate dehydrogenase|nr:quinone-dependent dihydroorotate dehydrogenase [Bacteroidota bacterium]